MFEFMLKDYDVNDLYFVSVDVKYPDGYPDSFNIGGVFMGGIKEYKYDTIAEKKDDKFFDILNRVCLTEKENSKDINYLIVGSDPLVNYYENKESHLTRKKVFREFRKNYDEFNSKRLSSLK